MPDRQSYPVGDTEHGQVVQLDSPINTQENPISWDAFEQLTVSSTALGLTSPGGRNYAILIPEAAAVRFRLDGGVPTATVGFPLEVGDQLILDSADELRDFRVIRRDGTDCTLNIQYGVRRVAL